MTQSSWQQIRQNKEKNWHIFGRQKIREITFFHKTICKKVQFTTLRIDHNLEYLGGRKIWLSEYMTFFSSKKKQGQNIIYYYSQRNGPTFGKILWLYFGQNFFKCYDCSKNFQVMGTNGGRQPISWYFDYRNFKLGLWRQFWSD